jgi:nucleoside-diphosphate-sugar epimerase
MGQRTVLLTGAAGSVARQLLPGLVDYSLRLVDLVRPDTSAAGSPADAVADADVRIGDVSDRSFTDGVVKDVDTVVHLAANPSAPAPWADLARPNIEAVVSVMEAAQRADVRRVVLASSVHAMGAYVQQERHPVDPAWPPYPCCAYGATKAFAEALGRTYSYRTGLSVVCLRFGGVQERPRSVGTMASWLGPDDLRRLVIASIEAADVRFGAYHGVSANTRKEWDISNAETELGYAPTLDSETYLDQLDPRAARGLCPRGPLA